MKQVILVREDLEMSKGKAVAQGAHASVNAVQNTEPSIVHEWTQNNAGTKITLSVDNEKQLRTLLEEATKKNIPTGIITDLGRTELESGTTTAGAIGPADEDTINEITGHLSLYR